MHSFYETYLAYLHRWDAVLLPLTLLVCSVLTAVMLWYLHARRRLCVSEEHFRNLAEASFEGIILSRNGGTICDCNERASEMSGFSRQELLQCSLYDLIAPEYHTLVRASVADGFDGPYEIEGLRADGSRYLLEVRGKTFQSGRHTMRASTLRDITARRAREAQLRKLSAAVEHSPASIVITNRDGAIEYVNPAFSRLTGYSMQEALGQNPRILKAGDQPEEFYQELWAVLLRGEEWRGEFHNKRKDGSLFWEMASISPILNGKGEILSFVAVKENITERKELRDRLEQMAQFDMLTGLPNRRMFLDRLSQAVAIAQRSEQRFALLFVDLDGFKRINDSYGHEAGDRVLKTVAARLAACIRISDTVGRIGGDEFTILLATLAHYEDAGQVADKILDALSRPISLPDGQQDTIGSSIGISVFPDDAQDGDSLLATADDAMYKVKRNGKNSYCFYHSCKPVAVVQETI